MVVFLKGYALPQAFLQLVLSATLLWVLKLKGPVCHPGSDSASTTS